MSSPGSAFNYALKQIRFNIPPQILNYVFGNEFYQDWRREAPASVDEMIRMKVIRDRVFVDCDIVGGTHAIISLDGLEPYVPDSYSTIFEIPQSRLGDRDIVSALSVNYMPHSAAMGALGTPYGSVNPITASDVTNTAQRVVDSFATVPHISSSNVEVIAHNTIVIRDRMKAVTVYELRCILSNESEMSNLSVRTYPLLAEACVLACKAYIYNTAIIQLGSGYLEQGRELGVFKDTIDSYADANELYATFRRERLAKGLFMNDVESHGRLIKLQINPGL